MGKKRYLLYFSVLFLAFFAGGLFFAGNLVSIAAKNKLENFFKGSVVHIGSCEVSPLSAITIRDLKVKRKDIYYITVEEAVVEYSVGGIARGRLNKARLAGIDIRVNAPKVKTAKLTELIEISGGGRIALRTAEASDVKLKVKTAEADIEATGAVSFSPMEGTFNTVDVVLNKAEIMGAVFRDVRIKGDNLSGGGEGEVSAESVKYNKVELKAVKGVLRADGNEAGAGDFSSKLFDGAAEGTLDFRMGGDWDFSAQVGFVGIDLEAVVRDLELEEKFQLTGRLSGGLSIKGKGFRLTDVKGELEAVPGGGVLVIKDDSFLERISGQSGQAMDIAAESLKNYVYRTGKAEVSLEDEDLILGVDMEGDSGKRVFDIVLHDIIQVKGR